MWCKRIIHAHALRALCGVLPLVAGCASSDAGARHDELTRRYDEVTPISAPADQPGFILFAEDSVLEPSRLVREVLARNQNLEAARQAWRAALASYRQAGALEDPVLSYQFAPESIDSDVPFGNEIELKQMFPFPGKRGLAGASAVADAEVAYADFETMRLELAQSAARLVYEAYRVERAIRINDDHIRFLTEIRGIAASRYSTGQVSQEEPLEAEVETNHLDHRRIELLRERLVIQDEMNALLHREPNAPLPPPPSTLPLPDSLAVNVPTMYAPALMDTALARRPELRSGEAAIRGREAAVGLAGKASLPDFGLMTSYSSMWSDPEHRWMVGVEMNVPLGFGRRSAGREQANAELEKARSEQKARQDAIRLEVCRALARMGEMVHSLELYRGHLLPASRDRVAAARASFETGSMPALTLIDAERNLLDAELGYEEALVEYHTDRLDLDRALGRLPTLEGVLP
jgi:outer membrane protein, heavy metal efflux system